MESGTATDYTRFRPAGYPVRHRRKVPFEPRLIVDGETRSALLGIDEMDGMLDGRPPSREAIASDIHASTAIEGNTLSYREVLGIVSGRPSDTGDPQVREVVNHLRFLGSMDSFPMPWTRGTILRIHSTLMEGVIPVAGELRDADVCVSDGRRELFIACPRGSVGEELDSLMEWVNASPFGAVVTATVFFHEFESIHPFADGNGRTGRALMRLILSEFGLRNHMVCRFEEEALRDAETYYGLLAYTDAVPNHTVLVRYMAEALLRAYEGAVADLR